MSPGTPLPCSLCKADNGMQVFKVAKMLAPSVIYMDEVEKAS